MNKRTFLAWPSMLLALALLAASTAVFASETTQPIGIDTLLRQETDLSLLPNLRDWSTFLQSSYDRTGGNGDSGNYLSYDGKTAVLADMDGPGAVVRIWSANPAGELKIYIDNNPVPVVDTPFDKLFDGSVAPFTAPLAQASSGGFYSYLPIPYVRHCRITVDNPGGLYYHVCYVTYPAGTPVRSFQLPLASSDRQALQVAIDAWQLHAPDASGQPPNMVASATVPPGKTSELFLHRGAATIRYLEMSVPGADDPSLRRLVLRGYFDGHTAPDIEAPVADFFGNAYGRHPFQSLLMRQTADGAMEVLFPMPFGKSARFTLENGNTSPVTAVCRAVVQKGRFHADKEGYFHAQWWQEITKGGLAHVWIRVQGQRGHLVGIVQTMSSANGLGFLEGDDQVRVDSQVWQPAQVTSTVIGPWNGTGTEDFFNSGWYFSGGPNALPVNGALVREDAGRIDAYRWFLNDAPVFQSSLDAQIETGAVNNAPGVYYSSVAYWYATGQTQPWAVFPSASQFQPPSP